MNDLKITKCFIPKDVFDELVTMADNQYGRRPKPIAKSAKIVWPENTQQGASPNGQ